ncbi:glycosyltransferase family 4 protein [Candidatus Micrarchaeota archaeon]|nr:glycosyltransferase family 4 protein [Candidatus Micrarchaeota archaeon]MBU2477064.1 glycosyltransferase family 4 protein [Candidatus Micrarchaeota archaeon]
MKVLMLGWEFPPFKSGGLGTYLYGFTKALSKKGVNITFVMPSSGVKINPGFIEVIQAEDYSHLDLVEIPGFDLHPYIASLPLDFSVQEIKEQGNDPDNKSINAYGMDFFFKVKKYTNATVKKMLGKDCDVIHCHDWMTFPAGIALKERKNKPLIVTIHSTEFDRTGNLNPNQTICEIERKGLIEADKVITISNYMKNQLISRYQIPEHKIQVVYNGIDKAEYITGKSFFPLNQKIVLFLGRLTIQKGPDWFLEAAYQTLQLRPDTRFIVVGDGDMLPALIDKSIQMGISDKIHFSGFQDNVKQFYSVADLFVMPSVSEPFGLTALEAMASNTPVIISKQSGVSEVISHCFKVDFWDSMEMANKMVGILNSIPLSNEMKKNAFTELQGFSWNKVADQCMQIYNEVS